MDATNFHDTHARDGLRAFPGVPYLAPPGFSAIAVPILPAPEEWEGELEVVELEGVPSIREHAIFHRVSGTLIVADLLFNLSPDSGAWTLLFMRGVSGLSRYPGMSRMFRGFVWDREAFVRSVAQVAAWDFRQIVVGHGEPVADRAKEQFTAVMERHGYLPGG